MNLQSSSPNEILGNFVVSHIYQQGDEVLSLKPLVFELPESWRVKGKSFNMDERSSREIILLYANSDIVLRQYKGSADDYYSLFLLPKNGYIQLQSSSVSTKSWAEVNAEGLRILFVKSGFSQSELLEQLRDLVVRVQRRKYKLTMNSSFVC